MNGIACKIHELPECHREGSGIVKEKKPQESSTNRNEGDKEKGEAEFQETFREFDKGDNVEGSGAGFCDSGPSIPGATCPSSRTRNKRQKAQKENG